MKKLLVLIAFAPLLTQAQDSTARVCKLNRLVDPFTKETRIASSLVRFDGGSMTIDADQREIDILFTINGIEKCFDNNSTAWIFFEGVKTKLTSKNGGTMNCEGLFHFIFKNTTSSNNVLQKLMTLRTDHIVFTGNNKKESTITIKEVDREKFIATISCTVEEAKKLIK